MLYYTSTHADVAESFLLGLSCLVGGDQFYIFVSKTDASPKTQSYITIATVLSTLFLAFALYDEYNRSLFDVTHVLYIVLLVIWGLILYQNVKNPFVTTYYISILGMVMTFLVIISCVHYSHQKDLLPSFLSGMLFARLLPTILWIFVHQKKAESKLNLSSLSARLALFRLVFCIISIILKFTSGNLDFSELRIKLKLPQDIIKYEWYFINQSFKNWTGQFKKLFNDTLSIAYFILLMTTTLFLFFSSIVSHLGLPPIVHKFSHLYSHNLYSRIDVISILSHILGVALGTKYPVSKTTNSYSFAGICSSFLVYFFSFTTVNDYFKFTSQIFLYSIVILNGFILGYVWAYSLGIITNVFLLRTCIYEEKTFSPCCGDKTESQCYCKLEEIFNSLDIKHFGKTFFCSALFVREDQYLSDRYSQSGRRAILLMYSTDDLKCSQDCSVSCTDPCADGICCLRLVGIYKIESVTTSTCGYCNLSIRLEANCSDPSKCSAKCASYCIHGNGNNCCCLCLKCCKGVCKPDCKCCIHLCNRSTCTQCCKSIISGEGIRLFICFKNNGKCCIREIRPNSSKEFQDDLTMQNQFDIKGISLFDCCHNDLTVVIQCSMKNNFFRVGSINYPKKTIKPLSLTLMRDGTESCNQTPSNNCCCKNTDLVTMCVKYDVSELNCKIESTCKDKARCCCSGSCPCCTCTDEKCCCCLTCELGVNSLTSFYNKIEPIRVKVVLIFWFFFILLLLIAISSESKDKNKKLKYYQFFPIRSFEDVYTYVDNNDMNSMDSVLERLKSVQQNIFLQLFGEKDKKSDLDYMFQLCESALDPCSLKKLRRYVLSKSSMLISSPQYINRRLNLELVKWSYCVGFVYTYIMLMFFRIQEYFLKWEQVWEIEYFNYTRIISKKFNNLTNKSKSSMSLMCEKDVEHKTILYTDTSKKGGWGCSNFELDIHANLNERETEMNKSPPHRLDLRLTFYLDKWKHRVENLRFWAENETNVYDWTGLVKEYPLIRNWVFKFLPLIQMASHEWTIPVERLNKGIEILKTENLNLIS